MKVNVPVNQETMNQKYILRVFFSNSFFLVAKQTNSENTSRLSSLDNGHFCLEQQRFLKILIIDPQVES